MLQIAICDDQNDVRLKLHALLKRLLETQNISCQVFEFSSGEGLLTWFDKHTGELDLVFLDIEMGGINGMETSKKLREQDNMLQIVFVTGYTDYVFDGYNVGALGYLLKPPKLEQLSDVVTRALSAIQCKEPELFFCQNGDNHYRINKDSILYFKSDGRKVTCFTQNRNYSFYGRLDEVATDLGSGSEFVRIHQRYLVRASAVEQISNNQLILNNSMGSLPVSRSYSQSAMLALAGEIFL